MLDLILFVKCSGVNARIDNLHDTLFTFEETNKNTNYKVYLVVDPILEAQAKSVLTSIIGEERVLDFLVTENTWAADFNTFFDNHKDSSEWLLISHDDVKFLTPDYFNRMVEAIGDKKDSVGWVTSTSEYYYKFENKLVTDTFRPGFHKDVDQWGGMFQLHTKDIHNPDYPKGPVKIHGPMSAIMLITMKSMKKVGPCESWTRYTMLIDEDWSLSALKNNLWNVWVPNVFHSHPNRRFLRNANNRWESEAHAGMLKKWGFNTGNANLPEFKQGVSIPIEQLREKYKGTNVAWSSYYNSYDWQYLHE